MQSLAHRMVKIQAEFNFCPIGQGCFYTGKISFPYENLVKNIIDFPQIYIHHYNKKIKDFNFVYDCGSLTRGPYLDIQINNYKINLGNYLDLLIISHFDSDHVNGVIDLLKNKICRRLIIPYYEPIERLLLYITSKDRSDDYRRMLQDPIGFFRGPEFNIEEIIIVGGPGGPNDDNLNNNLIPPERPKLRDLNLSDKKGELKFYNNRNSEYEDEINFKKFQNEEINSGSKNTNWLKINFLKSPYHLSIDYGIWEFIFYLEKMNDGDLIEKFKDEVDDLLKKHNIQLFDLFSRKHLKEIQNIYKKYYININYTSLVTYHGPLFECFQIMTDTIIENLFIIEHYKFGTLLTGDINLVYENNLREIINYLPKKILDVLIFQVPHHGSKINWDFDHPNGFENFDFYVINHGRFRLKHPSNEVVTDIKNNCIGRIIRNTEFKNFSYSFSFY